MLRGVTDYYSHAAERRFILSDDYPSVPMRAATFWASVAG